MQRRRHYDCIDCGVPCHRARRPDQQLTCIECGIARAADAAIELARAKVQGWPPDSKYPKSLFQRGGRPVGSRNRAKGET